MISTYKNINTAPCSLRIGSYNIKNAELTGYNMQALAEDININKFDIVGLQEVDKNCKRSGNIDELKCLSEKSELHYCAFVKCIDFQCGEYGIGILSRYPIISTKNIPLFSDHYEQRMIIHAVINVNGTNIDFFNTHTSFESTDIRRKQFFQIADELEKCKEYILTADFNTDAIIEFEAFPNSFIVNNGKYQTFITSSSAIDNIVYSSGWRMLSSEMIETAHSDHNILCADFKLIYYY